MSDIVSDTLSNRPAPDYAYTSFFPGQDANISDVANKLEAPVMSTLGPQKKNGSNRAFISILMILLIGLAAFQQLQISSLQGDLKASRATVDDLGVQIRNLQSQNDQVYDILRQFESRLGYVDNKVEHVIDDNVEKEQRLQAVQARRVQEHEVPEPTTEGRGRNVLKEIFGNLFR